MSDYPEPFISNHTVYWPHDQLKDMFYIEKEKFYRRTCYIPTNEVEKVQLIRDKAQYDLYEDLYNRIHNRTRQMLIHEYGSDVDSNTKIIENGKGAFFLEVPSSDIVGNRVISNSALQIIKNLKERNKFTHILCENIVYEFTIVTLRNKRVCIILGDAWGKPVNILQEDKSGKPTGD